MADLEPRVAAPRRVEAELVDRRMGSGRNQPLLLSVRDDAGGMEQCVIKPYARLATAPLEYLLEWVGSAIARGLGIPTPEPLAVTISADLPSAVLAEFRDDLHSSIGLVFGSHLVKRYTQLPREYALSPSQRERAAQILAFDVFIHNADRRAENSNLFVDRDSFVVFDHEMACDFVRGVIGLDPVLDDGAMIIAGHVFRASLRRKAPNFDRFRAALQGLDDAFFAELVASTPSEWTIDRAHGKLDKIVEVLQKRRDRVDEWLPRMRACLDR